jgi:hypothetical protein
VLAASGALLSALLAPVGDAAHAQPSAPPAAAAPADDPPARGGLGAWLGERVQVHGYLTQGVAKADSLPILGIPRRPTAAYRAAALQARVAFTARDVAVVQLANRRMGASLLDTATAPVTVQWAYYQRALPWRLTLKAGRSAIPRGIFNEVRKVGTVLPFYRAPYSFYTESYETLDGAVLSRVTPLGAWGLEASAYAGAFPYVHVITAPVMRPQLAMVGGAPRVVGVRQVRDTAAVASRRGDRTVGGQLWLSTPVQGLRLGGGAMRFTLNDFHEYAGREGPLPSRLAQAAVDGNFARWALRGEWEQMQSGEFLYTAYYGQGTLRFGERLAVHAQHEEAWGRVTAPIPVEGPDGRVALAPQQLRAAGRFTRDVALGASWAFRPDVIVKAEGHRNRGNNYDRFTDSSPSGRFAIVSLALSF